MRSSSVLLSIRESARILRRALTSDRETSLKGGLAGTARGRHEPFVATIRPSLRMTALHAARRRLGPMDPTYRRITRGGLLCRMHPSTPSDGVLLP